MYYIGVDLGTSAVKLLLMEADGSIKNIVSKEYPLSFPNPGWSEQSPDDWWNAVVAGIKELTDGFDASKVAGISFGGQMHGLVILDQDDNVIRPAILWNDGRTTKETNYLNDVIGKDKLSQYTANIAFAGFTAPKILWVKENEPENFAKIAKIMLPKDYIAYKMTGVHSCDYSDASGMLLMDVKNKCWSKEMMEICSVNEEQLPKLFESYEITGALTEAAAAELGLTTTCKIAAGAGDNAAAAVGTGTVGDGGCNISLGTSGTIFISSKVLGYENDEILGPTGAVAIPEFNTRFTRQMLIDTQPKDFNTLVRLSGFSHGTDVWLGNARDLIIQQGIPVGQAIGCRDDIMLFLISKGMDPKRSFKIMEAVRKGRGLPDGAEEEMKAAGVPDWYIGSCKKIAYLFPKAHAVAYVMMAFRIAWFKVHRPLAFYAAYFSIRAKAFDEAYMCRGMDVCQKKMREIVAKDKDATAVEQDMLTTLEVCYEFYLRGFQFDRMDVYQSQAIHFSVDEERGTLRPPFVSVAGLGETAAISLAEQRQGKQFISIEEVSAACPKVSKTHIQLLKEAGAFGDLPETSQMDLFSMLG